MQFPEDSNTKKSMYNTRNWTSYVYNSGMICNLMRFQNIMGCVVLNLVSTPGKLDEIWSIFLIIMMDQMSSGLHVVVIKLKTTQHKIA